MTYGKVGILHGFKYNMLQDENGNDIYNAPDEALEDILFERFSQMRNEDDGE